MILVFKFDNHCSSETDVEVCKVHVCLCNMHGMITNNTRFTWAEKPRQEHVMTENGFQRLPMEIVDDMIAKYMDVPSVVAWSMTCRSCHDTGSHFLYDSEHGRSRIRTWCRDRRCQKEDFIYYHLSTLEETDLRVVGVAGFYLWAMDEFHQRSYSSMLLRRADTIRSYMNEKVVKKRASSESRMESWRRRTKRWTWHHTRVYDQCLEELDCEEDPAYTQLKKKYNLLVK